ncbi:MAG: hypothetical protein LIO80_07370 [Lachnospiraceae bacterium]|nr:hypothetical protein [Lachnospiraceae bacterium]
MTKQKSKRLMSLLLSLAMVMSLVVTPAFAAGTDDDTTEPEEITSLEVTQAEDEALTVDYVEDEADSEENGIMLLSEEDNCTESFTAKIGDTIYTTLTAAINAASAGDTIVLGSDVSETIGISTGKDVTIDLAGHKISSPEGSTTRLITMRGGKLTITDSSSGGTITSSVGDAVILLAGGTLVVNGGTISATGTIPAIVNAWQNSNYADEASTVIVNGGTVTAAGAPALRNNAAGCSITVNGGEIVGYSSSTGYYIVDSASEANSGSVVITGGYFTTDTNSASQVLFYQGNSGNIVISGGYFNNAILWINSAMRAAGYSNAELDTAETYNNVDYKYTVASSAVFYGTISEDENGEEVITYLGSDSTPQKAVNALKNGDHAENTTMYIELAADVVSTVDVGTGSGTSVVLELNGHNISASSDAAIVVQDGVTLTVRDSEGTSTVSSSYSNGTVRNRGGVLNIEGGIYTNTTGCVLQNNGSNEATDTTYVTTIYGGTFTGTFSVVKGSVTAYAGITDSNGAKTYYATLNKAVSAAASGDTVTVYSNVEVNTQVVVSKKVTLDLAGYTVSRGDSLAYSALIVVTSGGDLTIEDSSTDGTGTIDGGTVFTNSSGNTFVCIAVQIVNGGAVTLTSGTLKGFYAVYAYGAGCTFNATGGNVTANEYANNYTYGIYMAQGADVTLSGSVQVTADSETGYGCAIANFGGNSTDATTLTIKDNAVITGSTFGISTNGSASSSYWCGNTAIVMEGGTVSGTWGMYLPAVSSTTTISGGTVTGSSTGIEIRAGSLTVTGGEITGNGKPGSTTSNGSGTTSVGAGIAISQHTTKQAITVSISGTAVVTGYTAVWENDTQSNGSEYTKDITITISGGTFNTIEESTSSAVSIEDAAYATVAISGGTYSTTVDPEYCADGYTPTETTVTGEGGSTTTTYTVAKFYLGISTDSAGTDESVPATIVDGAGTNTMYVKVSATNISSYTTTAYPTTSETYTSSSSNDSGYYIFAGWYSATTSEDGTTTYTAMTSFPTETTAYAKFVEANTMSIKGVVMESVTDGDTEGTKYWRIVTGLDSLNYDYIGFEVHMDTSTEATAISGYYWRDYTAQSANNRKFEASEFGTSAKYVSVCLVSEADSATSCNVRSCWTTLDGTKVYGAWYTCTYTSTDNKYNELNVTEVTANE